MTDAERMLKSGDLYLGDPRVNARGFRCCGKPVGCNMTHDGCAFLKHPWKRANVFHDPEARCQAKAVWDDVPVQCVLSHGHAPPCVCEP